MPFLKIDFSNYNSSDALQKELEQRMNSLNLPVNIISTCLGLRIHREIPKGRIQKFFMRSQIVWIVLISALLFIGALIASYNAEPVYLSLYCWGIIDFSFLIYWNLSRKEVDFFKQLMRSSTGVGILRKTKKNVMVKNLATSLSLVVAICTIIILSISLFDVIVLFSNSKQQSLARIFFSIISLATVIFCLPGANCAVFSHITQLSSEFFVIANDFHQDGNTYQIAVSRHYVHAHCQLIKLFNSVRKPLSYWCSVHLIRNTVVSYRILIYLLKYNYNEINNTLDLAKLGLLSIYLIVCLFHFICIVSSAISLRASIVELRYLMLELLSGDKALHDQTYSLCTFFLVHLRSHKFGLSFFDLTIIDRQFLNCILTGVLLLAVYQYIM